MLPALNYTQARLWTPKGYPASEGLLVLFQLIILRCASSTLLMEIKVKTLAYAFLYSLCVLWAHVVPHCLFSWQLQITESCFKAQLWA